MQAGPFSVADIAQSAPAGARVYLCGPNGFMEAVKTGFRSRPDITRIIIPPGQTILETPRAEGIEVETSCESGVCGACLTRVLSAAPVHQDYVLSEADKAANRSILICLSGALPGTEIVLDR